MTTFASVSSACFAAALACLFAAVYAHEDYGDYLIPETNGYYPLDKRSYNTYCRRCMSSDNDWVSCYKCWDRPGRSAPYYGGKKKRGYSNRFIVPYYLRKRAEETMDDLDQYLDLDKRGTLFKCTCCVKTRDERCCSQCPSYLAEHSDEEETCRCCQPGTFRLSCCLNCVKRK